MKSKRILAAVILLLAVILTACAQRDGLTKMKNAEISGAVLYALEGNVLQYDVFCCGRLTGAKILDESGNGIDSPAALAAVLGNPDAPETAAGCGIEGRTLGKAVTADIQTDSRGNITVLTVRSVTDRPVIGITWKSDTIGEDYQGFAEALERNGALAVYLPLTISKEHAETVLSGVDGLFVTGGEDWNPALYGQTPQPHGSADCNDIRDMSDLYLIRGALEADIPMLCVCRGAQGLNIALGGGLIRDIPSYLGAMGAGEEIPEGCTCEEKHLRVQAEDIIHHGNTYHPLSFIDPDSEWLYEIFGTGSLPMVSTAHHQAIDPENLGEGLTVAARSADGIIEAVEYRQNRFVLGLQWHPERDALEDTQNTGIDRRHSNLPLRALVKYASETQ